MLVEIQPRDHAPWRGVADGVSLRSLAWAGSVILRVMAFLSRPIAHYGASKARSRAASRSATRGFERGYSGGRRAKRRK
jgi:hypothetical protein